MSEARKPYPGFEDWDGAVYIDEHSRLATIPNWTDGIVKRKDHRYRAWEVHLREGEDLEVGLRREAEAKAKTSAPETGVSRPASSLIKLPDSRRTGPADVNPHGVPAVPADRGNSYTGRGWHGPNEPLAPRGEPTIYDARDFSAPRGAARFGDPHSMGGRNLIGPRGRFVGHGPIPRAGGPGGSGGVH